MVTDLIGAAVGCAVSKRLGHVRAVATSSCSTRLTLWAEGEDGRLFAIDSDSLVIYAKPEHLAQEAT